MSTAPGAGTETLPLDAMRRRVRDLLTPKPWIYWLDFLFHIAVSWTAFVVAVRSAPWSAAQIAACVVCIIALYRCVIFTHELAHLRRGSMTAFRWTWNLLCGFPVLLPSYTYSGVHNHHHRKAVYGTAEDGEYYPFAARPPIELIGFLAANLLLPGLLVLRFVVLAPLGWLSPRLQALLWARASSLTLDPAFRRRHSDRDEPRWQLQETLACVYGATAIGLTLGGVLPWRTLLIWYVAVFGGLSINAVRTVVAHRYRNGQRRPMTVSEQFFDSVDIPGQRWLTGLWAPLGLRYHATHHLFPSMPYHNLGRAYRRLALEYPAFYTRATRRGLLDALTQLWREARNSRHPAAPRAAAECERDVRA